MLAVLLTPRKALYVALSGSGTALGAASFAEHVADLSPCSLCLYQRDVYWAVVALSIAGIVGRPTTAMCRVCVFSIAVSLLVGSGIALAHVGQEQGWWEEACPVPQLADISLEQAQQLLLHTSAPSCGDVQWSLFGISIAGYNALYSLSLAGLCLLMAWPRRNLSGIVP